MVEGLDSKAVSRLQSATSDKYNCPFIRLFFLRFAFHAFYSQARQHADMFSPFHFLFSVSPFICICLFKCANIFPCAHMLLPEVCLIISPPVSRDIFLRRNQIRSHTRRWPGTVCLQIYAKTIIYTFFCCCFFFATSFHYSKSTKWPIVFKDMERWTARTIYLLIDLRYINGYNRFHGNVCKRRNRTHHYRQQRPLSF